MKISVIVPVYNNEKNLKDCIESILNQTYKSFELILINDGSSDNSLEICEAYKTTDSRIVVYNQINSGASVARNLGLRKMSGDYVIFVDADDTIKSNMLSEMLNVSLKYDLDFTMCGLTLKYFDINDELIKENEVKPRSRILNHSDLPDKLLDLVESEIINGPVCKLIKSKIITENNLLMPPNLSLQEDLYFNISILEKIKKMGVIEESYYDYNIRMTESVTKKYYAEKFEMLDEVHDHILKFYKKYSKNNETIRNVEYIYIKNVYAGCINLFHDNCDLSRSEKIKYIKRITKTNKFLASLERANKSGFKYSVLKNILKTKNVYLIYYFSGILKILKNKSSFKYTN